jgi:hypothetical protein
MKKLKKSISNLYDKNLNESSTTKITSEFSSSGSRFYSPSNNNKNSVIFFSPSYNNIQAKKNNLDKNWKQKFFNNTNTQHKKLLSDILSNKNRKRKKFNSLDSFKLMNTIKYNILDKMRISFHNKNKEKLSLNNSLKTFRRSLSLECQSLINNKNKMIDFYSSTGKIKQIKKLIEIENDNMNNEAENIKNENKELEKQINYKNYDTNVKNILIMNLNNLVNDEKEKCKQLSNDINQLIEDKKFLSSCLIDYIKKINYLNEKIYKTNLKSEQIQSGLQTIVNNFENENFEI